MSYRVEKDVMVPMHDGTALATDVWVPDGDPAPALLVRTPYGKDVPNQLGNALNFQALLEAGYAVVHQDCRGTFRSGGHFIPMVHEPEDGADTVDWIRHQPWCDGNVAGFGASYLGFTQWAMASRAPAGLKAIAPTVTTADYYTAPWYSEGGAFSLHMSLWWSTVITLVDAQRSLAAGTGGVDALMELAGTLGDLDSRLAAMPISDQPALAARASWWSKWLRHVDRDEYWRDLSVVEQLDEVTVPALHIGGWFDIFAGATSSAFTRMRNGAGSAEAREGQRLIIGPWDHQSYSAPVA